jgi:hypothetical protein
VNIRVALYAEGARESSAVVPVRPAEPGEELEEAAFGAAHFLVRRAVARARSVPEPAVRFLEPLRKTGGGVARGSDLLKSTTLRTLLTWPSKSRRPDVCVVLVDNDGDDERSKSLVATIASSSFTQPVVVGIAKQEFESWLLADMAAVRRQLGQVDEGPAVESLGPRGARERLAELCATKHADAREHKGLRIALARDADLGEVEKRASSFAAFAAKLRP